jgi:hypothetical protein
MKPGKIVIKDTSVLRGLMEYNYEPLLVNIICAIADKFGLRMSESYRPKMHRNDLHGVRPVRAIDLTEWVYLEPKEIERWINDNWVYDYERPTMRVALLHKTKTGVLHFHIQVHQNTRRTL